MATDAVVAETFGSFIFDRADNELMRVVGLNQRGRGFYLDVMRPSGQMASIPIMLIAPMGRRFHVRNAQKGPTP